MDLIIRETIGMAGSILVMLSYLFTGKKLRYINIIGSIIFIIYGFMLNGISMIILNSITIVIHLYYILKGEKDNE